MKFGMFRSTLVNQRHSENTYGNLYTRIVMAKENIP